MRRGDVELGRRKPALDALFSGERASSDDDFQQEFHDFHVPTGLGQIATPGVKSVPTDQITVLKRTFGVGQPAFDFLRQGGNVLGVLKNLKALGVVVRLDSLQPFEHFVAFDLQSALVEVLDGCQGRSTE